MWRWLLILLLAAGCDAETGTPPPVGPPRIASLSPAVTSYVVAMNGGGQLVAVSNYEPGDGRADLPRVGDYLGVDWEALAEARPDVIFVQAAEGRLPEGLRGRAARLGVAVERVEIDAVDDGVRVMQRVLPYLADERIGRVMLDRWRQDLRRVGAESADRSPVSAVVVTGLANGINVAGPGTYLDELLTLAGGTNAVATPGYVTLDPESLAATGADVLLVLAPDGPPDTAAIKEALPSARVVVLDQPDDLLPGYNMAGLAGRMAGALR